MIVDRETAEISYYALLAYQEKLEKDLSTRYDNHPNFGTEDVVFLRDTIDRVKRAIQVYLTSEFGRNLVKAEDLST